MKVCELKIKDMASVNSITQALFIEKVKEHSNKMEWVCSGALVKTEYTITKKDLDNLLKEFERKEDTIYDD